MISQSNRSVRYSEAVEDGLGDKVVEMQPPCEFLANPARGNQRHRPVDATLAGRALKNEFSHELLAWCIGLRHTLGVDVVRGRVLEPRPPSVRAVQASRNEIQHRGGEAEEKSLLQRISEKCMIVADPELSTPCHKIKAFFLADESEWTAAGFGVKNRGQLRKKKKGLHWDFMGAKWSPTQSHD